MELNSPIQEISLPQARVFKFLSDVKNWEILMPEKNERFEMTGKNSFNFQLKGMPEIRLKMDEISPEDQVVLASNSDKFEFYLRAEISQSSPDKSNVQFKFEGQFNAVMQMMVKKPLKNFIEQLSVNLKKIQ